MYVPAFALADIVALIVCSAAPLFLGYVTLMWGDVDLYPNILNGLAPECSSEIVAHRSEPTDSF
jgi:hypothetical protein